MMLRLLPSVFCRLVRNRRGVTVIEHTVLAGTIPVAATTVSNNIGQKFQNVPSATRSALT
jgi:Flp pilus assembly pilin Flp